MFLCLFLRRMIIATCTMKKKILKMLKMDDFNGVVSFQDMLPILK